MKRRHSPACINLKSVDRWPFPALCRTPSSSLAVLWAAGALTCTSAALAQAAGVALPANTLPVLRGVVSGQVVVNTPTTTATGSLLKIDQSSSRAVIDWRKFDIGSGSEVRFQQPGTTASVLNRIYSADPSLIQGKLTSVGPIDAQTGQLTAGGQIILINQNGILFDRGSQVNAYSLIASTLNLSNDFYARGLLSGEDTSRPTPAFGGGYRLDGDGSTDAALRPAGAIRIGAGGDAALAAPSLTTPAGGSIMLFAPVIDNKSGLIAAPDGQVILAAGSKVYLAAQGAQAQGIRGFLVEVSAEGGDVNLSSLIRNQGQISADRGNVTLNGLALNQEGRVTASTAVLYNGSVWLKASSKVATPGGPLEAARAGTVTLAASSVTATPIDGADKTTLAESQDYASSNIAEDRRGRVRIEGLNIIHQGRIEAPGGVVDLQASSPVAGESGRIYLDASSRIDASGNWADVAHESNFTTLRVTSTELKDAPDQKNGILKGATVTVDLRKSSSILDISGYVDGRRRTVGEKAAIGGSVVLNSSGDLIQRPGAVVDVSGGGYRYAAGTSRTSQLLGDDGRIYDISNAPQQRSYTAQLDKVTQSFSRWGQTQVFDTLLGSIGQQDAAYVEGRAAGSLSITAPKGLVLDGALKGGVTVGPNQLGRAPSAGSLTIGTNLNQTNTAVPVPALRLRQDAIDRVGPSFTAQSALPTALASQAELAADMLYPVLGGAHADALDTQRFGSIEINSRGGIDLPAGVSLDAGVGNELVLRANRIDVAGTINAPGGSVLLEGRLIPSSDATPAPERITLQAGASISTAGAWRNLSAADGSAVGPLLPLAVLPIGSSTPRSTLQGGSISVSGAAIDVQPGSTMDVSGGGSVARGGRIAAGNAGSVNLAADRSSQPTFNRVAGEFQGFSLGGTGGSLSITVNQAQIGGLAAVPDSVLRLDEDFFSLGGFSLWSVTSARELSVLSGTHLRPRTQSWTVAAEEALRLPSGASLASIARRATLSDDLRPAASLALSANGSSNGVLTLQQGASIATDPRGRITLEAVNGMNIDGRLEAPAGAIALNLRGEAGTAPVLRLGDEAELLARGAFVAKPADNGLRQGSVLSGGTVTLSATRGSIDADARSRIDVSGISQTLDFASTDPQSSVPSSREVDGHAGSLTVRAQERSSFASQIAAQAGGPNAAGGSFALEFTNRSERQRPGEASIDRRIVLTPAPSSLAAQAGVVDFAIDANRLIGGGFDKLRLQAGGRIEALGRTTLDFDRAVQLDAPEIRVADGGRLGVESAAVVLNNSFGAAQAPQFQGTTGSRNNGVASRPVATLVGTGTFNVSAGTIDLLGDVTLNGVAQTTLASDGDIRLSGRLIGNPQQDAQTSLAGSLVSAGNIALDAAQVLPTTRSTFTVAVQSRTAAGTATAVADGRLTIGAGGASAGDVLSADGSLTLRADHVVQGGRVIAPLGRINLDAGRSITLAEGSVTSVSADGLTLPYGSTIDQREWIYAPTGSNPGVNSLTAPPAKRIAVTAPTIDIRNGATLDLSGGGNVQALEFVPGTGGSTDTLQKDNTFAILPAARLSAMPVDRDATARKDLGLGLFTARPDGLAYDTIHIGRGAAVPEGDYVLLPGRYALLPDAYLVTLQTGNSFANLQPGQTASLTNGQVVVPGYRKVAGTAIREDATIGVVVRPGSSARRESDYTLSDASLFAAQAEKLRQAVPALPADGGRLAIGATTSLKLDGQIAAQAASPTNRVAAVDISAPRIAVIDGTESTAVDASYLKLDAARLSSIGGSLLLGGTRTDTPDGVRVTASANEIVLANAAKPLQAPELLLVATDQITARAGSVARGTGPASGEGSSLIADSRGALVRLSSGDAVSIDRGSNPQSDRGNVTVAAGATLAATGSMTIDATRSVRVDGVLDVAAKGDLALASGSISLGLPSLSGGSALVLGDAALRSFDALASLTLKSYSTIDLVGAVALGATTLDSLVLDAPVLRGVEPSGATPATLSAQSVTLRNSSAAATTVSTGTGQLKVDAKTIVLGQGSKAIAGFGQVELRASADVIADGVGALTSAATTSLQAARVAAQAGSDQTWSATTLGPSAQAFDFTLSHGSAAPDIRPSAEAGGRLSIDGKSVHLDTAVSMKSGLVTLNAVGANPNDGVTLGSSGSIDVGAYSKTFADRTATADAGSVSLRAASGAVRAEAGSTLSLAGSPSGGNAGALNVSAASASLAGRIDASAPGTAEQGRVALDLVTVSDFSALNNKLNESGFSAERSVRVRSGDIRVAATDTVRAHQIELQADAGRIDIDGRLDASAAQGQGWISLHAGNGLNIAGQIDASGSSIDVGAAAPPSHGGVVAADTRAGTLVFAPGATIDVRPGAKGDPGRVDFTAQRTAGNGIDVNLQGSVSTRRGAAGAVGEVIVQGRRVESDVSDASESRIAQWSSDHAAFMRAVDTSAATGGIRTDASKQVRGVLELQTTGDFSLATDWDLTTSAWLTGAGPDARAPGVLTVRAAGDISVSRSLGLPDDKLVDGKTWSIQLAAGSDLSAANPMSVRPLASLGNKGNVRLQGADAPLMVDLLDPSGNPVLDQSTGEVLQVGVDRGAKIRTGTGSIAVVAGRDFIFERGSLASEDAKRVIYTAGAPSAPGDASAFLEGLDTPWAQGGGDVTIRAQRDAVGGSNQWVNGWLRRPRGTIDESGQGGWFVYRPNFQQNIGALGGGDVFISAGNDVLNLSAAVPTMGRVVAQPGGPRLEVTGGGDLNVIAGKRIEGGDYLVGRGAARLQAGASVGATTPTQLWLMGESGDPGQLGASAKVSALTGVKLQSVDNPSAQGLPQSSALGPQQFVVALDGDGNPFIDPATGLPVYFPPTAPRNFADSTQNASSTFFTYAPNTALMVQSLAADIGLGAKPIDKPSVALLPAQDPRNQFVLNNATYPGVVDAVAFSGSINGPVGRPQITLFSTPQSSLGLLAAKDIDQLNLFASDRAASNVAAWDRPSVESRGLLTVSSNGPRAALQPVSAAFRYDLVAAQGSIGAVSLDLPAQARVQAGLDIVGGNFTLQNQSSDDVSVIRAVEGDVRPTFVSMAGPGRLLVQAGRNIDAGNNVVLQAIGNSRNESLGSAASARLTFIAGVTGPVDLSKLDSAFVEFADLNKSLNEALALYKLLNAERDSQRVLGAASVAELAQLNPNYQTFVALDKKFPSILATYQGELRGSRLPLGQAPGASRAAELYVLLNAEQDPARLQRILAAPSLTQLAAEPDFSARYASFADLDKQYPVLFTDYRLRRSNGFTPTTVLPIVFGGVLDQSVAKVFPGASVAQGNIDSFLTSIQTIGGSSVDLVAPAGDITVGLTTPRAGREVGVITTGGGAIRSYLSGNFNINQGKVVTAQGGDILIFTNRGNIDAGRGARTSQTSPAPVREPILEAGVVIGFTTKIPPGFSGSGIQTLSSDPDGQGPLPAAQAGTVLLFTPAGYVDAGEAGIVSGGDLIIVAQTVLNAANISAGGSSVGVPVATSGSLASSLASGGTNTSGPSKPGEEAASASASAARAAAAAQIAKPTILVVEVLGFGDKNCKEQDKDCFAK